MKHCVVVVWFAAAAPLQGYLIALWFLCRLRKLHRESTFVSMQTLSPSPYENRYVRKLIDACSFRMYATR